MSCGTSVHPGCFSPPLPYDIDALSTAEHPSPTHLLINTYRCPTCIRCYSCGIKRPGQLLLACEKCARAWHLHCTNAAPGISRKLNPTHRPLPLTAQPTTTTAAAAAAAHVSSGSSASASSTDTPLSREDLSFTCIDCVPYHIHTLRTKRHTQTHALRRTQTCSCLFFWGVWEY